MSTHRQSAWLDAMGIDRWVERGGDTALTEPSALPLVQWLSAPASPVLTVLSAEPLDDSTVSVLDKMLNAISVSSQQCALAQLDTVHLPAESAGFAVLVLASEHDEAAWRALTHAGAYEVIAHPSRFAVDAQLKRPAWEALKRLSQGLHAA